MRGSAILALALLSACTGLLFLLPSLPPMAAEEHAFLEYAVSFDPARGDAAVTIRFRCEPFHLALRSALSELVGPSASLPSGYFRDFHAYDESGSPLEVEEEGGVWKVRGGKGILSYTVDPALLGRTPDDEHGTAAFQNPFLYPVTGSGYILLPAPYLLLLPALPEEKGALEHFRLRLRFDPPPGWEAFSPRGEVEADSLGAVKTIFLAATAERAERGEGFPLVSVIPTGADPANIAALDEFAEKMSSFLEKAAEAWGLDGLGGTGLVIFLGPQEGLGKAGFPPLMPAPPGSLSTLALVPNGPSENILGKDLLLRSLTASLRAVLGELDFAPDSLWFRDGASLYCGLRIARSLGLLSGEEAWDLLAELYARYRMALDKKGEGISAASATWAEEDSANLYLGGGAVVAATLDTHLSERGLSLDGFIADLLKVEGQGPVGGKRLQEELRIYSGEDFSSFFHQYIEETGQIPPSGFSKMRLEEGEDSDAARALPSFGEGHKWVYMAVTAAVVFAVPFLLEPYTLRPRRGSVEVKEEEEDGEEGDEA